MKLGELFGDERFLRGLLIGALGGISGTSILFVALELIARRMAGAN